MTSKHMSFFLKHILNRKKTSTQSIFFQNHAFTKSIGKIFQNRRTKAIRPKNLPYSLSGWPPGIKLEGRQKKIKKKERAAVPCARVITTPCSLECSFRGSIFTILRPSKRYPPVFKTPYLIFSPSDFMHLNRARLRPPSTLLREGGGERKILSGASGICPRHCLIFLPHKLLPGCQEDAVCRQDRPSLFSTVKKFKCIYSIV